ncbi:hypothetical protein MH216_21700, partial [Paenibacillus larvae]|uniref:hypothetical protein n=1 Tax=Paenibacillus larvae TaxID=1464 RepID=UPI002281CDB1
QFGMFIHCHPHLSILDLFLIRQMVPFSLPRFAKNIDSTYIESWTCPWDNGSSAQIVIFFRRVLMTRL